MMGVSGEAVKIKAGTGAFLCQGCGAGVRPDPLTGNAVCDYCGTVYTYASATADGNLLATIETLISLLTAINAAQGEMDSLNRQLADVRREKAELFSSFKKSFKAAFSVNKGETPEQAEYRLMQQIQSTQAEISYLQSTLEASHIDLVPAAYRRVDILSEILHILKSAQAATLPDAYRLYEELCRQRARESMEQQRYEQEMELKRQQLELEKKKMELQEQEEFERFMEEEDKKDKKSGKILAGVAGTALAAGGAALASKGGRKLLKEIFNNIV